MLYSKNRRGSTKKKKTLAATLFRSCSAVAVVLSCLLLPPSMMPPSARRMIPLMEESGQTDEERRRLRQKQRNLLKTIVSQAEAMANASSEVFGNVREENNVLFQKVFYTREAVLDGENLNMISERAAKQVEGLVQVSFSGPFGGPRDVLVKPRKPVFV
jgi:hypothetical protein